MSSNDSSFVLFSGPGADERLFREQRKRFSGLAVIPWLEPRRGETLADYASRLANEVVPRQLLLTLTHGREVNLFIAEVMKATLEAPSR